MSTQKRFTTTQEARNILKNGSVGILCTVSPDGRPYAVPVHYCFSDEENCAFFHCAKEGRKIDNILFCPQVSLVVVGAYEVIPEKITTCYESAMLFGPAGIVEDPAEKTAKLRALCVKFAPKTPWASDDSLLKACGETHIIKISAECITGKRNRP
jgi:nitroimidazol reductase NimA-like FMN-containing flavoprotein (pyridoxamine 5'-phosphate oxidase superfamily)